VCVPQDDYRQAVIELDEKEFTSLRLCCCELRNHYVRKCFLACNSVAGQRFCFQGNNTKVQKFILSISFTLFMELFFFLMLSWISKSLDFNPLFEVRFKQAFWALVELLHCNFAKCHWRTISTSTYFQLIKYKNDFWLNVCKQHKLLTVFTTVFNGQNGVKALQIYTVSPTFITFRPYKTEVTTVMNLFLCV